MWNEFMQMSAPAAFVLAVAVAAPCFVLSTWSINRTTRRRQELEHLVALRKASSDAKVIEPPAQQGREVY